MTISPRDLLARRRRRVRYGLSQAKKQRPRLSIFRSNKNIYAQIIDDASQKTLSAASSLETSNRGKLTIATASEVGKLIGEKAKKAGIEEVVFDRGGYKYHGRVKALADGAREAGLKF